MFKRVISSGLRNGAALTAVTTAALLAASANENTGPWGAINNVTHIIDGDSVEYGDQFSLRDSGIGFGINATAMFTWGFLYDVIFGRVDIPVSVATASLFTIGAYIVDYYIVPDQYTPGIEHKISKRAILFSYLCIVLVLALSPYWTQNRGEK